MELNEIKKQGKWTDISDTLNENFAKVNAETQRLELASRKNKGYYATYDELASIVPQGSMGDIAFVGSNYPYHIYKWNGTEWIDTFETGGAQNVNLADYYTRTDVDNLIKLEEQEREQAYQELNKTLTSRLDVEGTGLMTVDEMINFNPIANGGSSYLAGYLDKPSRYVVTKEVGGVPVNVGILEILSDSSQHIYTQVFTTHFVLDNSGNLDLGSHSDTKLVTYFRSYSIDSPLIDSGTWTKWKDISHYSDMQESIARNKRDIEFLNANTGISEYHLFDEAAAYSVGEVVLYKGLMYRFTSAHEAGAWDGSQVEDWSLNLNANDNIDKLKRVISKILSGVNDKTADIPTTFSQGKIQADGVIDLNNTAYKISEPILLDEGDFIAVTSFGNFYSPICECDAHGNIIRLLVQYASLTNIVDTYYYLAQKKMYVKVCVYAREDSSVYMKNSLKDFLTKNDLSTSQIAYLLQSADLSYTGLSFLYDTLGYKYFKEYPSGTSSDIHVLGIKALKDSVINLEINISEEYELGQGTIRLLGKNSEDEDWTRIVTYYSTGSKIYKFESNYDVLAYQFANNYTSASISFEMPGLYDLKDFEAKIYNYYVCESKDTFPKTVTAEGYTLKSGSPIIIKFTNANTRVSPTLSINGTEEKQVIYNGLPVDSYNTWKAGEQMLCYYDGEKYQLCTLSENGANKLSDVMYLLSRICDKFSGWEIVTPSFIDGYVYTCLDTSVGKLNEHSGYKYSEPIHLLKGQAIRISTTGNNIVPIQECDSEGNILHRLVSYPIIENVFQSYSYIAPRDMYVVLCGKREDSTLVEKSNDFYSIPDILEDIDGLKKIMPHINPTYSTDDFEIGNITITTNGWTYGEKDTRVRTKRGTSLSLYAGQTIGLSDYSNGNRFYIGWRDAEGNYQTTAEWHTSDVTLTQDGQYVILIRHNPETTIEDATELSSLVVIKPKSMPYTVSIDDVNEAVAGSEWFSYKADMNDSIMPVMHGGTRELPQNCLSLYKLAAKHGVLFWECDVLMCADGYVVCHEPDAYTIAVDDNGNALTEGEWIVRDKTIAELKTLRVGVVYGTSALVEGFENDRMPTLKEYLDLAKIYNAIPIIEVKFYANQTQMQEMYNIVKRAGFIGDKCFWLFYSNKTAHASMLQEIDDRACIIYCGGGDLTDEVINEAIALKNEKNKVALYYYVSDYTPEFISKALDSELLIGTWSGPGDLGTRIEEGYSLFSLNDPSKNPIKLLRQ